jgi:hypothetical protein
VVEYPEFATSIDARIKSECMFCPPDAQMNIFVHGSSVMNGNFYNLNIKHTINC